MSVTESPESSALPASSPSGSARRPTPSSFRPGVWRSPIRGPWLTSFLGTLLIPAVAVLAVTGFVSHWADDPQHALFLFSASWPSWSYALSQGTHVTLGLMALPFVLAKLWSVMPKLFVRPVIASVAGALDRLSLLLLVGSVLLEFSTGILNIDDTGLPGVDFTTVHYYGAWVFVALFVLHAGIKLPTVRRAYRERGVLRPLLDGLDETEPEPPGVGGLAPVDPAAPTISRRGLLAMIGGASLTICVVQAGESIGGPFRKLALLAPRGRVFGTAPNDFQITHTAAQAQITSALTGADWRLSVVGARIVSYSREQLLAMQQSTHSLTITCTEGWSTTQRWTGVSLTELARLADAPEGATLTISSLEASDRGPAQSSLVHLQFSDPRALLALKVNGVDLSPDHGFPARVIMPNVPGHLNTKWVRELRFEAA